MTTLEQIIENNRQTKSAITSIQAELVHMQKEIIERKKRMLRLENETLTKEVKSALAELINIEVRNGKKQISVPGIRQSCNDLNAGQQVVKETQTQEKTPKEKKAKLPITKKINVAPLAADIPIDICRIDLRVGKIIQVERLPDADSLYLGKIDCGETLPRTVVSGLVKYLPIEEMQNRMVVVMCNLKPTKKRGVTSEAMVMCASSNDKVEVLSPPASAVPGDLVHCIGYNRQPDVQLNPKKKIFETCAPDLKTNDDLVVCYKGAALHVPGKGNIVSQTLKNACVK